MKLAQGGRTMAKRLLVFSAVFCAATVFASFTEVETMPAAQRRGLKTFSATYPLDVGNYDVTFTFGDETKPTESWVKFEGRRIALEKITTKPGEKRKVAFTARVKGPIMKADAPTGEAPFPYALNLTVITSADAVAEPEIKKNESARVIYLCGDSTVTDQQGEPWGSWGQCLPIFFKEGAAVANFAKSGLHTTSFRKEGRLERILASLKAGDVVVIQFGHNDQKQKWLAPQDGYKGELADYIAKIKEKGAEAVIISPMERLRFDRRSGAQQPKTLADYAQAAREVAEAGGVPFIDLNDASYKMYGALGAQNATRLFCTATIEEQVRDYFGENSRVPRKNMRNIADKTHHSIYGAYVLAHYIADKLAEALAYLAPLRREGYIAAAADAVEDDPEIPPSGIIDTRRPEGDTGNKE